MQFNLTSRRQPSVVALRSPSEVKVQDSIFSRSGVISIITKEASPNANGTPQVVEQVIQRNDA